jgi:hypothetical protein
LRSTEKGLQLMTGEDKHESGRQNRLASAGPMACAAVGEFPPLEVWLADAGVTTGEAGKSKGCRS